MYDAVGDMMRRAPDNTTTCSGTPTGAQLGYDAFGSLTSTSESFGSGTTWTNPYRYDGRDGVRYDGETGLYWMSVRAYDPALGRFLSRDPLGRSPLFFSDQPYGYAGNNPLINVDPSGQRIVCDGDCLPRVPPTPTPPPPGPTGCHSDRSCGCYTDCGGGHGGYLGNFGDPCTSVSNCKCKSLKECTGVQHPEVGQGLPCNDSTACFQGDGSDGLFHYLLHDQGQDAASIILNGKSGIEWFLKLLDHFQTSVDQAFDDKVNHAEVNAAIVTGALTIIGALAGSFIGAGVGFAIGGALTGTTTAALIGHLQDQKSAFNTMILNFGQQLLDVEGQLTDDSNTEIVIAPVTPRGPLEGWEDQQLQITDVFGSP